MLSGLSLVIGGGASGKTTYAEQLVKGTGRNLIYLATAQIRDNDMRARIYKHKETRNAAWRTIEEPFDIGRTLAGISGDSAVLLDSTSAWLLNHLVAENDLAEAEAGLMAGLALCAAPVVIVGDTGGSSEHSDDFQRANGQLNQKLAKRANLVVNVIAGLPLVLKGTAP